MESIEIANQPTDSTGLLRSWIGDRRLLVVAGLAVAFILWDRRASRPGSARKAPEKRPRADRKRDRKARDAAAEGAPAPGIYHAERQEYVPVAGPPLLEHDDPIRP